MLAHLRAAHLSQQVVVTGGVDGTNIRDEVLCGILLLVVFYLALVSRCFSSMLRQERGHKPGSFKGGDDITTTLLKSTLVLSVALVISIQSKFTLPPL